MIHSIEFIFLFSEIEEEINFDDDSYDKSQDKKLASSGNNYTISQSGGLDGTVDSKELDKLNYVEYVEK